VRINIRTEDAEVAVQTGELDGWRGLGHHRKDYLWGWADCDQHTSVTITSLVRGTRARSLQRRKMGKSCQTHLKQIPTRDFEADPTTLSQQ